MLDELKIEVLKANLELPARGLVTYTWGNVSGVDRKLGLFVIKPSGVPYDELKPEHLVVLDFEGKKVEGDLNPSSDMPTHLVLYKSFPEIGGIVHTHSRWATVWSQAGRSIPALGTTHADYFYGDIPCTRKLKMHEIGSEYEKHTGDVIAEAFYGVNPMFMPAVLVNNHGPFSWGKTPAEAVHNSVVLEELAMMACYSFSLSPDLKPIDKALLDKHFLRKHGKGAYYGQK
jgi:L-ribulose-5-phosphate 4-epimerase